MQLPLGGVQREALCGRRSAILQFVVCCFALGDVVGVGDGEGGKYNELQSVKGKWEIIVICVCVSACIRLLFSSVFVVCVFEFGRLAARGTKMAQEVHQTDPRA